jgi:hypothetical protein
VCASAAHDFSGFGAEVDSRDRLPPGLKLETVETGTRADVEHVATTMFEGCHLNSRELGGRPEKMTHGEQNFEPVIPPDRQLGRRFSSEVVEESKSVRRQSFWIHVDFPR